MHLKLPRLAAFHVLVIGTLGASSAFAVTPLEAKQQAQAIVAKMTLDEKIAELHGAAPETLRNPSPKDGPLEKFLVMPRRTDGVPRLGIPGMYVTNGPSGVALGDGAPQKPATAFASPISLAATW